MNAKIYERARILLSRIYIKFPFVNFKNLFAYIILYTVCVLKLFNFWNHNILLLLENFYNSKNRKKEKRIDIEW